MTSEIFLLYLLTRLDSICSLCVLGMVVSGFIAVICMITMAFNMDQDYASEKQYFECAKTVFNKVKWVVAAFAIVLAILPSRQDAMFIVAGTGIIEAAKSDTAQRLAGKSVKVIENYLDKLSETKK